MSLSAVNELTDSKFWEKEWENHHLQKSIEQGINNQILKYVKSALTKDSKILEIGCVPAKRLETLHKQYFVEPYGLDYAFDGLRNSIKQPNNLVCSDLFNHPFKEDTFDFVYSLGVIEHFKDPGSVITKHFDLAKKGGIVLITVPNFNKSSTLSLVYRMAKKYNELSQTHNMQIMDADRFRKLFSQGNNFDVLISDFYGPMVIHSPPIYSVRLICSKINKILDHMAFKSKVFSPDLVFVGKKR
jgi:2-polyprenyl-3-methyl-5-hydroxy-6-metoxy-1,4-benzoquinol methylase